MVDKEECTRTMGRLLEDVTHMLGEVHRLHNLPSLDADMSALQTHLERFRNICLSPPYPALFIDAYKAAENMRTFAERCDPAGVFASAEIIGVKVADVIETVVAENMKAKI